MIKITFADNEEVDIDKNTKIMAAQSSYDSDDQSKFSASGIFMGTAESPELKTKDPLVGFEGLLNSADWISFGNTKQVYKTSAIIKIEEVD